MATFNSIHRLLQTQKPFSSLLTIFFFFFLLLKNVNSESFSFDYPAFSPHTSPIFLQGDAIAYGGVILLTKRDMTGSGPDIKLYPHSVGRAFYFTPFHLWDNKTGTLADFTTEFTFVVHTAGKPHGDGLSFFIAPFEFDPDESHLIIPQNSSGGYLGLFSPKTALDPSQNQIVAVELDAFGNEWDPNPINAVAPHVGININSIKSVTSAYWPIDSGPDDAIGKARISYKSKSKELSVLISYTEDQPNRFVSLSHVVDLRSVLPEWVQIGFSASTGDLVETHDILSWSFRISM